ncbi:MAG: hypothetical protein ACK5ML_01170 [Lachnospiraceae bacterium]
MGRMIRIIAASLIYSLGYILAAYVGGYIMIFQPINDIIQSAAFGSLTMGHVFISIAKIVLSATVAGAIWCIMYMISNSIYDKRDHQ